ncbi:MAG: terminase large subunit [Hyphomicrobiales bacterium]|nr:terminase large subunit [Hyphomicrobiales bacterium]
MDYTKRAESYANGVLSGAIPACLYVNQACQRFLDDVDRAIEGSEIWFDVAAAEKRCEEIEKYPHVKGKWAAKGELLELGDWQVFVTVNIFGFKIVRDGKQLDKRRYREAYVEVPRKNGKTFFIVGVGLTMLTIDNEFGAEVYCGATSEKQAFEVFTPARAICKRDTDLKEFYGIETNAKSLVIPSNGSKFEPVIGDPGDGSSPSCGIADEYHEHRTSNLVDTFITGMGAREQPLMLYITTAGSDMGGPCYEKRDDVIKILSGAVDDDSIFGIIYTLDEGDEWDTVEAQVKANPNYGVSVDKDFLSGQLAQARRSATKQVAYKTKHLNLWVGAKAAWMNMLAYQACRKKDLKLEDFKGERCYVALDLASKIDIASMAVYFPDHGAAFCFHYLPEETILEGGNTRYKAWHATGDLIATPGNIIDYSYIEDDLEDLKSNFQILEVPYDPFQATQFATRMMERGFPMVEYGATVKNFSEPMKELEAMILQKKMKFTQDPVLLWMFGNVVAKLDKKDNIFPDKERRSNKIDGVVALVMAIGRSISGENPESVYAERGILTL